jgi:Cd2+/Zn2+-exporting ATPase
MSCQCCHDKNETCEIETEEKSQLPKIIVASVFFVIAILLDKLGVIAEFSEPAAKYAKLAIYILPYFVVGYSVLWEAIQNILKGKVFDENFLMALATVGAFILGEYPEGVLVMLLYQIGELFEDYAVGKSRKSITELMNIRPDYANVPSESGIIQVSPDTLKVSDIIIIKPGEKVPLDGIILEGNSTVDTSALTGESLPREVGPGDSLLSGCINTSGVLKVQVTKVFGESTVARILEMVEQASDKKAKTENFITRFAKVYTPIVVISAAILGILPPLFFGQEWAPWIERALIFLVISCPCALVISVPLGFFAGIGRASKSGILIKGSNSLEAVSRLKTIVFDKTGTLTKGVFTVNAVHADITSKETLLEYAALAEFYSNHPISLSIKEHYEKQKGSSLQWEEEKKRISNVTEIAGHGVKATIDGKIVAVGNCRLMDLVNSNWRNCHRNGTIIHISIDGEYQGHIVIADVVKPESQQSILDLKKQGIKKTVMLTGDAASIAQEVGTLLGIDEIYAQLLPVDKVAKLEEIMEKENQDINKQRKVIGFVGDGINDAPVLTRADVGIAMGGMGSDAAIEAADIVLMDDNPKKIAEAIKISKKTIGVVKQNIVFALGIKGIILFIGALGFANMWLAVFADVGVSFLAILNSMRILQKGKK